jgi:hypothetical protein
MAVVIPIVSEFDGKGLSKAIKEFQQLEGAGEKAQFALKKAALPAAAALGGLAVAIGDATKAAIEDEKAQLLLANAIEKNTLQGQAAVAAAEAYIEKTMMSAAVADDVLRPALATLVQTTGSLEYSQELLNASLDISAATGTDLATVTDAVAKAYAGNTKALGNLVPSVRGLIKDGASLDQVMAALAATTGGAATVAANSADGQLKRLSLTISETKEAVGAAFLPILEKLLPRLQQAAVFFQQNSDVIVKVALAVGALSAAVLVLNTAIKILTAAQIALNFAMAANPIGIVVVAVAALVGGFVLLVQKVGGVTNAFKAMGNHVIGIFEGIVNAFNFMLNGIISAINLIPGVNIPLIPKVDLPRMSYKVPGGDGDGSVGPTVPTTPDFLERSLIKPIEPVLPVMPAVPAPKTGGGGGGGGGATKPRTGIIDDLVDVMPIEDGGIGGGGIGGGNDQVTIMVNVNAAIAEASIGQTIVDALTDYTRRSGPLQLEIA